MRDSILSWPLLRCIEMESTRVRSPVRRTGVRPLRVCDTHNARTAFANLLFHATSENVCACLCRFSLCVELDLPAFALAQFLAKRLQLRALTSARGSQAAIAAVNARGYNDAAAHARCKIYVHLCVSVANLVT